MSTEILLIAGFLAGFVVPAASAGVGAWLANLVSQAEIDRLEGKLGEALDALKQTQELLKRVAEGHREDFKADRELRGAVVGVDHDADWDRLLRYGATRLPESETELASEQAPPSDTERAEAVEG